MIQKLLSIDKAWLIAINNFANTSPHWERLFKLFGIYLIYAVPLMLVLLWFWSSQAKKVALKATLAGLFSWMVLANILGRIINRPRPFENNDIHELVFHRPTYSFPSDHAAFLFAVAFSLYLSGFKKLGLVVFIGAILIVTARVGVGFHFPSDIIAGAILGILVAWIVWLLDRPLNYIYNFIIIFAKRLKWSTKKIRA
ncbi:MAG: ybjG [Candidatus Berkelbacteria bacterium]|nr:ybjG [Candidatus Berkelbacteria bacterium]